MTKEQIDVLAENIFASVKQYCKAREERAAAEMVPAIATAVLAAIEPRLKALEAER